MIKHLKLDNIKNHNYFVQTVNEIQSQLGFNYTIEEIEQKCLDDGYRLYFKNKKTKNGILVFGLLVNGISNLN